MATNLWRLIYTIDDQYPLMIFIGDDVSDEYIIIMMNNISLEWCKQAWRDFFSWCQLSMNSIAKGSNVPHHFEFGQRREVGIKVWFN